MKNKALALAMMVGFSALLIAGCSKPADDASASGGAASAGAAASGGAASGGAASGS